MWTESSGCYVHWSGGWLQARSQSTHFLHILFEVSSLESGVMSVDLTKVDTRQIGPVEAGIKQFAVPQAGPLQIGFIQNGACQIRPA